MSGWFSRERYDFFVHSYSRSQNDEHTNFVTLRFEYNAEIKEFELKTPEHVFTKLLSPVDENENLVLLDMHVVHIHNETPVDIRVQIHHAFDNSNEPPIETLCPSRYSNVVSNVDSHIYRQKLKYNVLRAVIGYESYLREDRIQIIQNNENDDESQPSPFIILSADDPLVFLLLTFKHKLPLSEKDFRQRDHNFYQLNPSCLQEVRRFFETTVFDMIHYTRFSQTRATAEHEVESSEIQDGANLILTLQVRYIAISGCAPPDSLIHKTWQI